jgi:hypothetical protein
MRIIGIDPGLSGAVAVLCDSAIEVHDVPTVANELNIDELVRIIRDARADVAIVERAAAMPKQGVSSTFRYGTVYGAIRAVVTVCTVPSHLVTPARWKKHFNLSSDKERSRALAIQYWPGCGFFNLKKHHNRAETLINKVSE